MVYGPSSPGASRSGTSINSLTFSFDLMAAGNFDADPLTELVAIQTTTTNGALHFLDPRGPNALDFTAAELAGGSSMWSTRLAVGNFLEDDADELVIVLEGTTSAALFPDTTAGSRVVLPLGAGAPVAAMTALDVDADGLDELVVVVGTQVHVYDVTMTELTAVHPPVDVPGGIAELVVADLGRGSALDIGYFKPAGGFGVLYSITDRLERGTEFFQLASAVGTGKQPVAANFVGPDRVDLAGVFASGIEIYENVSDDSFNGPARVRVDGSPDALVAADLDGDGRTDFAYDGSQGGLTLLFAE